MKWQNCFLHCFDENGAAGYVPNIDMSHTSTWALKNAIVILCSKAFLVEPLEFFEHFFAMSSFAAALWHDKDVQNLKLYPNPVA